MDEEFQINTTNLYKILAQGRNNVIANVYGGNINMVSRYRQQDTVWRMFLLQINFDVNLWRVHNYYHGSYSRREKQVDTSITGVINFFIIFFNCSDVFISNLRISFFQLTL